MKYALHVLWNKAQLSDCHLNKTPQILLTLFSHRPSDYNYSIGYSCFKDSNALEGFSETVLTSTHNLCFEQKYEKVSEFFI